jgi:putative FmdB family regulatory protein
MPTYQYRCLNCNREFELKQSFNDKPIADCPTCHDIARRIFCPVPIIFNGPGFYVTDSREGKGKGSSPSESGKKDNAGSKS